ncbi:hypothetical protein FA13DRAFT_1740376 [Coprinellus micaceus]|uniref:Uncharacterized protein n=1 Tax=Coprinellus micaceus TaxID=71717 RepID=A0A4Y7SMR9_COPMI|nr:hypothetical protein FA13DRAFT_1740376 [Coprinellus micaceus]
MSKEFTVGDALKSLAATYQRDVESGNPNRVISERTYAARVNHNSVTLLGKATGNFKGNNVFTRPPAAQPVKVDKDVLLPFVVGKISRENPEDAELPLKYLLSLKKQYDALQQSQAQTRPSFQTSAPSVSHTLSEEAASLQSPLEGRRQKQEVRVPPPRGSGGNVVTFSDYYRDEPNGSPERGKKQARGATKIFTGMGNVLSGRAA